MGKTLYSKTKTLIENNFDKGEEVGFVQLTNIIIKEIGGDPRTTSNVMRTMLTTKLIKDIGNSHFKML